MKIRFKKNTNIRSDHQSLKAAPIGVVYAQTVLEVEDEPHPGASIQDDNRWWRDLNGWYYWAGETEVLPAETENAPKPKPKPRPKPKPAADLAPAPAPEPPPEPSKLPIEAEQPVALPVPDDEKLTAGQIPEGEWRLVRDGVSIRPEL